MSLKNVSVLNVVFVGDTLVFGHKYDGFLAPIGPLLDLMYNIHYTEKLLLYNGSLDHFQ